MTKRFVFHPILGLGGLLFFSFAPTHAQTLIRELFDEYEGRVVTIQTAPNGDIRIFLLKEARDDYLLLIGLSHNFGAGYKAYLPLSSVCAVLEIPVDPKAFLSNFLLPPGWEEVLEKWGDRFPLTWLLIRTCGADPTLK